MTSQAWFFFFTVSDHRTERGQSCSSADMHVHTFPLDKYRCLLQLGKPMSSIGVGPTSPGRKTRRTGRTAEYHFHFVMQDKDPCCRPSLMTLIEVSGWRTRPSCSLIRPPCDLIAGDGVRLYSRDDLSNGLLGCPLAELRISRHFKLHLPSPSGAVLYTACWTR